MLLVDAEVVAGIGSANLTRPGLSQNLEAWRFFSRKEGPGELAGVRRFLEGLLREGVLSRSLGVEEFLEALGGVGAADGPVADTLNGDLLAWAAKRVPRTCQELEVVSPVKSIPLGRPHQERAYKFIRKVLRQRRRHEGYAGGIVLADGVGSGKTYEALAAVATLLSQRQHRKALPRKGALRVLVAVPPRLLSKWEDELRLPEKFLKYLAGWERRPLTRAVHETFRDIKVLRRTADLWDRRGQRHYGHDVLPGGLYLANWNLLWKDIRKATQLHRTPWDAIIVDEAHHVGDGLVRARPHTLIRHRKTAVLLLTATPFQLNPGEMEELLTGTFGGYGSEGRWPLAQERAAELYGDPKFKRYRRCLNRHFEHGDPEAAREGQALRREVERLLGRRVLRNPRKKHRRYHLVDSGGNARVIKGDPFTFSDERIRALLDDGGRIQLDPEAEAFYLEVRAALAQAGGDGRRAFVAGKCHVLPWTCGRSSEICGARRAKGSPPQGKNNSSIGSRASSVLDIALLPLGQSSKLAERRAEMRLVGVRLSGFRCFRQEIRISIGDLTALIGRNEAGKSSVLEALAIFFGEQKIDADDGSKGGDASSVTIACEFADLPEQLVLDADHPTTLADEWLLNERGNLDVVKVYDCTKSKIVPKVSANAFMPDHESCRDLMEMKNPALKKRLKDLKLSEEGINLSINSQVRARIRQTVAGEPMTHVAVSLESEDGKKVWSQIEPHLPLFALFKSDRPSTDQDEEAQDPMKAAIREAVKAQEESLAVVTAHVQEKVTAIAEATVQKLKEVDPALASVLTPEFDVPDWTKVFKIRLSADDGIPVNKRGSGVRRLILLSFFRARAERRVAEADAPGIVYAVEEPETSQHPDNQRLLCSALAQLAENAGCQVLLSTHTPGLGRMLPLSALRYISPEGDGNRTVHAGTAETYRRVCDGLGVLPDKTVRLFVGVEGTNDIEYLRRASKMLVVHGGAVPNLEELEAAGQVIFLPLGGNNVIHWRNRLELLEIPEFHLYDRGAGPVSPFQGTVDAINDRPRCRAVLTGHYEMENYIHPDAIEAVYPGVRVPLDPASDIPLAVAKAVHENAPGSGPWEDVPAKKKGEKESAVKRRLNAEGMDRMTPALLASVDPDGHVQSWFRQMAELLDGP